MRISNEDYLSADWRTATLLADFELVDAWQLPLHANGETGQTFADFCELFAGMSEQRREVGPATSFLFGLREALGRLFGWDRSAHALPIPGDSVVSLRDRLTADERDRQAAYWREADRSLGDLEFRLVYRLPREQLVEISNSTVHAAMHLVWVRRSGGEFTPQMGVFVKERGWFGAAYMALISPFRHLIVYPALFRSVDRRWQRHLQELAA